MNSKQNFEGSLSSESSYEYEDCFSQPIYTKFPVQKSNVSEKIKLFSESSQLSLESSYDSFKKSRTKTNMKTKIPFELKKKLYKSRTEICNTRNGIITFSIYIAFIYETDIFNFKGVVIKTYIDFETPNMMENFSGRMIENVLPRKSNVLTSFEKKFNKI